MTTNTAAKLATLPRNAILEGHDKIEIDGVKLAAHWYVRDGAFVVTFFARETTPGRHAFGRGGGMAFRSAARNEWLNLHDNDARAVMLRAAGLLVPGFAFDTYKGHVCAPGHQWLALAA